MAKAAQDESANTSRQQQGERDTGPGFRDFRQAGREAESATRRFQAATAEFLSGMMSRPYVDLLRDTEEMTQQWTQSVRTSVEQSLNIASKINETAINELRRSADFLLQICETGASLQRSLVREAESQSDREAQASRAHAAE